MIDSIVNIDNNLIDITSHLYKKTNNVSIQTDFIIYNKEENNKEEKNLELIEYNKGKNILEKLFICNIL